MLKSIPAAKALWSVGSTLAKAHRVVYLFQVSIKLYVSACQSEIVTRASDLLPLTAVGI